MFRLITGVPGAGKTLNTVHNLKDTKDRPVYYHGIPALNLPWQEIQNPKQWHLEVPNGAIVIIDEAQKHFPARGVSKGEPPEGVSTLETHRHRGLDVYWITQHPSLIDHHARRLVGEHWHYNRNNGLERSVLYIGNTAFNPNDRRELAACERQQIKFPSESYGLYKSAEVHTHKRRLPKKLLWIPVLLGVLVFCVLVLYNVLFARKLENPNTAQAPAGPIFPAPGGTPGQGPSTPATGFPAIEARPVKAKDFLPAIPGVPASAPIYAEIWRPVSVPRPAACAKNEATGECRCYSQQGTRLGITTPICINYIKFGYFDFTKPDPGRVQERPESTRAGYAGTPL